MLLTFILIIICIPSPPHSFIPGLKRSFYTYHYLYSITPSLFYSRLKTFLFCKSFPPQPSFSSSELTTWIPRTVYCYFEHIRFFTFQFFFVFPFSVVVSVRQIKLTRVGFSAHVKIASRIVFAGIAVFLCCYLPFLFCSLFTLLSSYSPLFLFHAVD